MELYNFSFCRNGLFYLRFLRTSQLLPWALDMVLNYGKHVKKFNWEDELKDIYIFCSPSHASIAFVITSCNNNYLRDVSCHRGPNKKLLITIVEKEVYLFFFTLHSLFIDTRSRIKICRLKNVLSACHVMFLLYLFPCCSSSYVSFAHYIIFIVMAACFCIYDWIYTEQNIT